MLFDEATHRIIGCGIVGPNAGDLIAEAALAIEMGADAADIGLTIHPHPTLSETDRHGGGGVRGHDHRPLHARRSTESAGAAAEGGRRHGTEAGVCPADRAADRRLAGADQGATRNGSPRPAQRHVRRLEKAIAALRENVEQASKLLAQARDAQENAWKDMQAASQSAFEQLQKGWADALGRFR